MPPESSALPLLRLGTAEVTEIEPVSSQRRDLRHLFPRSLNVAPALIGARAYCGHRRTQPWDGGIYGVTPEPLGDLCVVCVEMAKTEGWG